MSRTYVVDLAQITSDPKSSLGGIAITERLEAIVENLSVIASELIKQNAASDTADDDFANEIRERNEESYLT